ncbi:serine hydrolase domain-containing protein [Pedococcus sp. KACC 23699]|uniref:Serine hydrolase domain-containing protein n=1 Tax=Pedococcus sp. KACC 23699 TaxID=3149228 RepID=A0AAU7JW39_9MICO
MPLPTSSASAQNVDARGLLALVDALETGGHDPHSLLVARHGHVIARGWWAPYAAERNQLVYSLSKSFTAATVGLLVDAGRVSLDDRVFDLLPAAELPAGVEIHERFQRLTLGHCLTMATGHAVDAWTEAVWRAAETPSDDGTDPVLGAILAAPPEQEPGTIWAYNQVATYLAAAVVRAVTGEGLLEFARPRLLEPLGAHDVRWHRTATGREIGFSGIHVGADAILALAQTHLDGGQWQGAQLLSAEWVARATAPTGLPNTEADPNPDWDQGYGCSFWNARHGYRGDGAYGQFAMVLPEQDIAIAITSEATDMQAVLDLVWEHLLPAVDQEGEAQADDVLAERLSTLRVPTPASTGTGPDVASWTRSADSALPPAYGTASLTRVGAAYELVLDRDGTKVPLAVGDGEWVESVLAVRGAELPVVAAGGWQADGTFAADLRLIETPHTVRIRTRTDGTVDLGWREVPLHGADPVTVAVRGPALPPQS